jgi:hypothetical protein
MKEIAISRVDKVVDQWPPLAFTMTVLATSHTYELLIHTHALHKEPLHFRHSHKEVNRNWLGSQPRDERNTFRTNSGTSGRLITLQQIAAVVSPWIFLRCSSFGFKQSRQASDVKLAFTAHLVYVKQHDVDGSSWLTW